MSGFNVTSLTDFTEKANKMFREGVLLTEKFADYEVQTGISYKEFLNFVDANPTLQPDGCGLNGGSGATLSEKVIEVGAIGISEPFCYKGLEKKALADINIEKTLTEDMVAKIATKTEKLIWQGDKASGDTSYGFKHWIDEGATSLSDSGTITVSNIDDKLTKMINAITPAMQGRGKLKFHMSLPNYNLYKQSRLAANYFRDANAKLGLNEMDVFGYEGQISIKGDAGLAGVDDIYLSFDKNFVIGMDEIINKSYAKWIFDPVTEYAWFKGSFKIGTQIKYGNEIIKLR